MNETHGTSVQEGTFFNPSDLASNVDFAADTSS